MLEAYQMVLYILLAKCKEASQMVLEGIRDGEASLDDEADASCFCLSGPLGGRGPLQDPKSSCFSHHRWCPDPTRFSFENLVGSGPLQDNAQGPRGYKASMPPRQCKDPRLGLFAFFTSLEKRVLVTYRRDFLSFLICPLKVRVGENSPNL